MGIPGVHRICEIFEGAALGFGILLATFVHDSYPYLTWLGAFFATCLAGHGFYRLVWRWWHGLSNLLSDKELEE